MFFSYILKDFYSIHKICANIWHQPHQKNNRQEIKEIAFRALAATFVIGGGILSVSAVHQLLSFTNLKIIAKTIAAAAAITLGHDYIIRSQPEFETDPDLQNKLFFRNYETPIVNSNFLHSEDPNQIFQNEQEGEDQSNIQETSTSDSGTYSAHAPFNANENHLNKWTDVNSSY